jgi:hypothetical protein
MLGTPFPARLLSCTFEHSQGQISTHVTYGAVNGCMSRTSVMDWIFPEVPLQT